MTWCDGLEKKTDSLYQKFEEYVITNGILTVPKLEDSVNFEAENFSR